MIVTADVVEQEKSIKWIISLNTLILDNPMWETISQGESSYIIYIEYFKICVGRPI